ncbi:MAG: DUF2299 family protein [Candidatus Natronoplasma sp.]
MKEQILRWLDEDDREYQISDQPALNWLIQLKHGNRMVLLGNPKKNEKRLEVVYKLNVSDDHKKILKKLNDKQRSGFEKTMVMMLAVDSNIYNIQRDDENLPDSIVIKKHLYDEELGKGKFFDTIQYVVNMGMRTTMHFQSLGGAKMTDQDEVSSTKTGPSIYR